MTWYSGEREREGERAAEPRLSGCYIQPPTTESDCQLLHPLNVCYADITCKLPAPVGIKHHHARFGCTVHPILPPHSTPIGKTICLVGIIMTILYWKHKACSCSSQPLLVLYLVYNLTMRNSNAGTLESWVYCGLFAAAVQFRKADALFSFKAPNHLTQLQYSK